MKAGYVDAGAPYPAFIVAAAYAGHNIIVFYPPYPNAVSYEVFIGASPRNLLPVSGRIPGINYVQPNTTPGRQYFVQVVANLGPSRSEDARNSIASAVITPLYTYYSSELYPVNAGPDSLTSSGAIQHGYNVHFAGPGELTSTGSIVAGALIQAVNYGSFDAGDDRLTSAGLFLAGALVVTTSYGSFDAGDDKLTSTGALISGSLEVAAGYIDYTIPDENLISSGSIISGTLT